MARKVTLTCNYVHMNTVFSCKSTLKMEAEIISETLDHNAILTWLIALGDSIDMLLWVHARETLNSCLLIAFYLRNVTSYSS
jgi:hypothetical protein